MDAMRNWRRGGRRSGVRRRGRVSDACVWECSSVAFEPCEPRLLLAIDPTANEQHLLELLNRFRLNPAAELALLTTSLGDPARSANAAVDSALRFFNTSGTALAAQWAGLQAVQPLAWNEDLYEAAEFHTLQMIASDMQTHQAPGEPDLAQRARNAGYNYSTLGENVYAYAYGVEHAHAGFVLDWGNGPNGIQDPPGHRNSMLNGNFREIGIRMIAENSSSTEVGPWLVTQDLGSRFSIGNAFLLGVVYADGGGNGYDAGEGLGGVTVQVTGAAGTYIATTMSAGGYQLQVPPGMYDITFSGAGFGDGVTHRNIEVGFTNVKLDGVRGVVPPTPNIVVLSDDGGAGSVFIAAGDRTPSLQDGTDFGRVNLSQSMVRTFTIRNTGDAPLELTGSPRVEIIGNGRARFTVLSTPSGVLRPGESTSFSVLFVPNDTRLKPATIKVLTDDPDQGNYTFKIQARGERAPDIGISGRGVAILDGDTTPTPGDATGYSNVNIVRRQKTRIFTIVNHGSTTLNLLGFGDSSDPVRIAGVNASEFVVIEQPTLTTLEPGQMTTFRVRFNPAVAGIRQAVVQVRSDDRDEAIFDFVVRGIGVLKPIAQVWGGDQRISTIRGGALPTTENRTDFGERAVGNERRLRTFTIRNVGSAMLNFTLSAATRVWVEGDAILDFEVMRQPRRILGIGESSTFKVRFDPDLVGWRSAVIVIDSLNGGQIRFNVGGTGV